ncbi:MAG: aryl-sulfate sulfotransferase, partial [Cyclobacteriaceae bacterium]
LNFPAVTLLVIISMWSCSSSENQTDEKSEAESDTTAYDQNMFGHHIPRGVQTSSDNLLDGYVMYPVPNSTSIYLVNREGLVVHEWKGNTELMSPYLMDDGSIYSNAYDLDFPTFGGGGNMGRIQHISWDSKMLWDFEYATEDYLEHHDIAVMPNGNILAIAWEPRTKEEVLQAGRDPEYVPNAGLWPDKIIEIRPLDEDEGEIVWEWHAWDHLIQDRDSSLMNYGDPAQHPELLDINASPHMPDSISADSLAVLKSMNRTAPHETVDNRGSDVYHLNAINYNSDLDQIAVSSPELGEIFIIDHSTTTEEAAGHSGGRSGKGGDFLYRWGNPENYHHGDSTDKKLFYQHDVKWIPEGYPGAGNLMLYNNDIPTTRKDSLHHSAIYELNPEVDENGNYMRLENGRFGPEEPAWVFVAKDTVSFYGAFISGSHRLPNGNTFITEGPRGRFLEVSPEGEIVWEFLNPFRGNVHNSNMWTPPMFYSLFRATFIG